MERPPKTETRAMESTAPEVNERIWRNLDASVLYHAMHPDEIDARLNELEWEWDIERMLEVNAGSVIVGSMLLGLFSRKLRLLPIVVGGFLAYHAVKGWCPPLPVFRRMGIRTTREINTERYALKALRGDFKGVPTDGSAPKRAQMALQAARNGVA